MWLAENTKATTSTPTTFARGLFSALLALAVLGQTRSAVAQRQMENLTRGIVAVKLPEGGVFVSWRLLGTDPEGLAFHLYRVTDGGEPAQIHVASPTAATNFMDQHADTSAMLEYFVRPVLDGQELPPSKPVRAWDGNFLEIPIQPIDDYRPGDASIADLDGDGQYEIVLHQTSRGQDNSFPGITGIPVLDAYKLDGTHLWRISLGVNIREGEHYTQFMVYDLDGDGRAEVACKTADGTVDGQGGDARRAQR